MKDIQGIIIITLCIIMLALMWSAYFQTGSNLMLGTTIGLSTGIPYVIILSESHIQKIKQKNYNFKWYLP